MLWDIRYHHIEFQALTAPKLHLTQLNLDDQDLYQTKTITPSPCHLTSLNSTSWPGSLPNLDHCPLSMQPLSHEWSTNDEGQTSPPPTTFIATANNCQPSLDSLNLSCLHWNSTHANQNLLPTKTFTWMMNINPSQCSVAASMPKRPQIANAI